MQNIVTCIGFNNEAEEAVNFYTSVVKNSKVLSIIRFGDGGPGPKGSVVAANFVLDGQEFMALNGGPTFTHTVGMSIMVKCDSQAEIDHLWERLLEDGGKPNVCGWLNDRFGVSWQIVPRILPQLLVDPKPSKAQAAMQAMLQMSKLDIAALQSAADAA
jgi:predicted 3-demethylubiquinone-9 3-methyltransferase (glyoxalase superfamily)